MVSGSFTLTTTVLLDSSWRQLDNDVSITSTNRPSTTHWSSKVQPAATMGLCLPLPCRWRQCTCCCCSRQVFEPVSILRALQNTFLLLKYSVK